MRRSHSVSRARRRGQALLLAVLIMIFAALVSASFIAVVSVNLNQTARQSDKNRAITAAKAGLDYVNHQLTYSDTGDQWFGTNFPQTTLTSLSSPSANYYSSLDRAQGWAGFYAKFPDPRDLQGDGPVFLAKVERVPYNTLASSPDFVHAGALKITVIGLSAEDPTAWHRTVAYKGGANRSPIAREMRVVSNWDYKAGLVPVGLVGSYSGSVLALTDVKGTFPAAPFAILIGDPIANKGVRGATVISSSQSGTTASLTLGETLATPPTPAAAGQTAEKVELAATLGAPLAVDSDNDGVANTSTEAVTVAISDPSVLPTPLPGGIRNNGGLWMSGTVAANNLNQRATNPDLPNGNIQSAGPIAFNLASAANANVTVTDSTSSNTATLVDSSNSNFPGTGSLFSAIGATGKDLYVSDGWNRMKGATGIVGGNSNGDGIRDVAPFTPPDITTGEGLQHYRNLTRYSKTNTFFYSSATAPLYGYGDGIYIDNTADTEKVPNGAVLRDMTQAELTQMWLSPRQVAPATPPDFSRVGSAQLTTTANVSLEQQHLRGWVGPDEFRARGVEIVLGNDSSMAKTNNPSGAILTITRDGRDDGFGVSTGAAASKTWKDQNGTSIAGLYTEKLPWPNNGVLFAEGNVRIRGVANDAPRSLTVVSMNNIYIEDTLQLTPPATLPTNYRERKILLLAKRNVVMNPTRVLGRPDAETVTKSATTATVGTPATLTVEDASQFQVGDFVQGSSVNTTTGAETVEVQGYVTSVTATDSPTDLVTDNDSITINPTLAGTVNTNDVIRTPNSAPQSTASAALARNVPYSTISSNLPGTSANVIQRRLNVDGTNFRLAFNHSADRKEVFDVKTTDLTTPAGLARPAILISNKMVPNPSPPAANAAPADLATASTIGEANKRVRAQADLGTGDEFPMTPPALTEIGAQAKILTAIASDMTSNPHSDTTNSYGWNYVATPSANYGSVPFFYLAGLGNRRDYIPTLAGAEWRKNIGTGANSLAEYNFPLATSVNLLLSGAVPTITDEQYQAATSSYGQTKQFGFSPTFLDATSTPVTLPEDILTGDQGFYQLDPADTTIDSRSLGALSSGSTYSLVMRQSDGLLGLTSTSLLPDYRLAGLKAEDVLLSSGSVSSVDPGHTFTVNAYVYAQNGSWFVIPGGLFDERLKGDATHTYLDLDNNGSPTIDTATGNKGEFIDVNNDGVWDAGDYADLNRDGIIEPAEKFAMSRYSRYNYQINFTGAIAENQTALVNSVTSATNPVDGAVQDWMTKWSTSKYDGTTQTSGRINYIFDPTIAIDNLQQDDSTTTADEADHGFQLPQTTELYDIS